MPFLYFLWHLPNHGTYYTTVIVRILVSLLQASKDKMSHFCTYTAWHRGWGDWIFINLSLERDLRINSAFSLQPFIKCLLSCVPTSPPEHSWWGNHWLNTGSNKTSCWPYVHTQKSLEGAHSSRSAVTLSDKIKPLMPRGWQVPTSRLSQVSATPGGKNTARNGSGKQSPVPSREEACWPKVNAQ